MIEYPCNECLVKPICKIFCYRVFEFMNTMADNLILGLDKKLMPKMPDSILFKIDELLNENKRFACPESIEAKRFF